MIIDTKTKSEVLFETTQVIEKIIHFAEKQKIQFDLFLKEREFIKEKLEKIKNSVEILSKENIDLKDGLFKSENKNNKEKNWNLEKKRLQMNIQKKGGENLKNCSEKKSQNEIHKKRKKERSLSTNKIYKGDLKKYVGFFNKYVEHFANTEKKQKLKNILDLCLNNKIKRKKLSKSFDLVKKKKFNKLRNILDKEKKIKKENQNINFISQNNFNCFNKIFMRFFLISCDKLKLTEFSEKKKITYEILYEGDISNEKIKPNQELVKFIHPFSSEYKIVDIENQIGKINEKLFQNNLDNDLNMEFFCIKFNSQTENFIFENPVSFLQLTNSSFERYYYIIKFEDFFIDENFDNPSKIRFLFHHKYYVFETFFPLSIFYKKLLIQFLYSVKKQKLLKFMESNPEKIIKKKDLVNIDSYHIQKEEIKIFQKIKYCFKKFDTSSLFNSNIVLNFFEPTLKYNFPEIKTSLFCESEFGYQILETLSFEDFYFILTAILLEHKIIFISESSFKLSAILSIFINLIKPFKWVFPTIFNLPEDLIMMIGSPLPMLIGINNNSHFVFKEIIPKCADHNRSTIYFFLDHSFIFYDYSILEKLFIPNFDSFHLNFKKLFQLHCNKKSSTFLKIFSKKIGKNKIYFFKNINFDLFKIYFQKLSQGLQLDQKQKGKIKKSLKKNPLEIFFFFNNFIHKFIIKKLNDEKIFNQSEIDEIKLQTFSNCPADLTFLQEFFKTQSFVYFLENEINNFKSKFNK